MAPPARRLIKRGKTLAERQAARSGISLRGAGIGPRTEQRYQSAIGHVMPFLENATHMNQLDEIVEEWIEREWHRGTPLGLIGDCLCGLHFFWPQAKGWLRGAWKLFRNWRRLEIPQRDPPLPRFVVLGLLGYFLDINEPEMAFLLALGFHTFLRTGEILKLQVRDVSLTPQRGAVAIRRSKTGIRFNIDESVAILDCNLYRFWELCFLARALTPSDPIWPHSAAAFRKLFYQGLDLFHLQGLQFQCYSIRRGGATASFATSQDLNQILLRGRWRALAVARLYLEDGQSQPTQIQMSRSSKTLLATLSVG